MSWTAMCAGLLVAAAWLAFPEPHAGLRRLRRLDRPGVRWDWLEGRPGAPPLRQRVLLGIGGAALALVVEPSMLGLAAAAPVGALLTIGAGWMWPGPRADPAVARQLPETLDLLAACLQAGAPMGRAVATVAEVSEEPTAGVLERVAGQLRLGRGEADAWLSLAEDAQWGAVAKDVARSARSGTSLVQGLRVHADDQRRRVAGERTKRARAVGVRSVVPLMVCFLPAFVLVGVVPIVAGLLSDFLG